MHFKFKSKYIYLYLSDLKNNYTNKFFKTVKQLIVYISNIISIRIFFLILKLHSTTKIKKKYLNPI